MEADAVLAPAIPRRRVRWRPRFTLLTFLFFILCVSSAYGLWWRWGPAWECEKELFRQTNKLWGARFLADGTRIVTLDGTGARVLDADTGLEAVSLAGRAYDVEQAVSRDNRRVVTFSDTTATVWDTATGQPVAVLTGHRRQIRKAVISADGRRVLTVVGEPNDDPRVWDAETGTSLAVLPGDSVQLANAAAFSRDGRLVAATSDGVIFLWDADSGQRAAVLRGHERIVSERSGKSHGSTIHSICFSPDRQRVLTSADDATARVWEAQTGVPIAVLSGHGEAVVWAEFSPDGRRIVTASHDCTARLWDADSGRELAVLSGHSQALARAYFSPDGRRVLTVAQTRGAGVWDVQTGRVLGQLLGHKQQVSDAAFSPDGTRIVTTSYDGTGRLWRRTRPEAWWGAAWFPEFWLAVVFGCALIWCLIRDRTILRPAPAVPQAGGSRGHTPEDGGTGAPPGRRRFAIAACCWRSLVLLALVAAAVAVAWWRWPPVWAVERTLAGHAGDVNHAVFSPDGHSMLTAGADGTARVWDVETGREVAACSGHEGVVRHASFSPDGARIVTASDDATARVWDARTGQQTALIKGHKDCQSRRARLSVAFVAGGARVMTTGLDYTAALWDSRTGAAVASLAGAHHCGVQRVAVSLDGRRLATVGGCSDGTLPVWDARSGKQLLAVSYRTITPGGSWLSPRSVAFSPDGKRLVAGDLERMLRIWDAKSGKPLIALKASDTPEKLAFSPDGSRILAASEDGIATIWDARTGKRLAALKGLFPIEAAFFPDSERILTAGAHRVCVWDACTGKEVAWLQREHGAFTAAAFSPDGRRIVTANRDGAPRVWKQVRPHEWWGVFWLAEVQLGAFLGCVFVWSVVRDWRARPKYC